MPSKKPVISFRVTPEQKGQADELAERLDRTVSSLAEMAFLTLIGSPPESVGRQPSQPVTQTRVVVPPRLPVREPLLGGRRIGPKYCTCIVGEPEADGACRKCRRPVAGVANSGVVAGGE